MYRCRCCTNLVKAGLAMLRAVVKRPDGSIKAEHPVCHRCHTAIEAGTPFDELADRYVPSRNQPLFASAALDKPREERSFRSH